MADRLSPSQLVIDALNKAKEGLLREKQERWADHQKRLLGPDKPVEQWSRTELRQHCNSLAQTTAEQRVAELAEAQEERTAYDFAARQIDNLIAIVRRV